MAGTAGVRVLGVSGSLRRGSYNSAALRAAAGLLPDGMRLEIFDLAPIPLFNEDVRQQGLPAGVQAFRDAIRAADALLIVTPEYNYSVPGVLKNAIDWASRPPDQPFADKPVGLMSAATGRFGGARAQYHLRQSFVFVDALAMNRPEVMIVNAREKFDAEGRLTDEPTRDMIRQFLAALDAWARRLSPAVGRG